MDAFEVYYIVVIAVLIALCLISHIVISVLSSDWSVKVVFCAISGTVLFMCLMLAFVLTGIISLELTERLHELRTSLAVTLPALALTIISATEFVGMLHMLLPKKKRYDVEVTEITVSCEEYPIPSNERKAGERIHGDYKRL